MYYDIAPMAYRAYAAVILVRSSHLENVQNSVDVEDAYCHNSAFHYGGMEKGRGPATLDGYMAVHIQEKPHKMEGRVME